MADEVTLSREEYDAYVRLAVNVRELLHYAGAVLYDAGYDEVKGDLDKSLEAVVREHNKRLIQLENGPNT